MTKTDREAIDMHACVLLTPPYVLRYNQCPSFQAQQCHTKLSKNHAIVAWGHCHEEAWKQGNRFIKVASYSLEGGMHAMGLDDSSTKHSGSLYSA